MIDLRRLRYFVAVAESLHFGKAAAKLHISQPPLSRQIQQLEQEIGALLLRRSKRHVELTGAGEQLLVDSRRLLLDAEQVGERTRRAATGASGRLALGFISAVDYSILPGVLRAYREAYPDVTLELRELTSDVQLRELHDSRIDAGMLLEPYRGCQPGDDAAAARTSGRCHACDRSAGASRPAGDAVRTGDTTIHPLSALERAWVARHDRRLL